MAISNERRRMLESAGFFLPGQYQGGKTDWRTAGEHVAKFEQDARRKNFGLRNPGEGLSFNPDTNQTGYYDEVGNFIPSGGNESQRAPTVQFADETFDPAKHWNPNSSSAGGMTWDQMVAQGGYKPVYHESSLFDQVMGIAQPLAMTAGMGYGITNLAGLAGLGASAGAAGSAAGAAGVAPEVGAMFSGLDSSALAGVDLAGAGAAGAAGYSASQGSPGMWDWIDGISTDGIGDIPGYGGGMDFNPAMELDFSMLGDGVDIPGYGFVSEGMTLDPSSVGFQARGLWDTAKNAGSLLKSGVKSLFGGDGKSMGGSILSQITGDPLGAAFNSAPFLLALAQAKSQADDLDGVLNKINGDSYSRAVLNPYDLDTALGRTRLDQDLMLRGVSGSSFGRNDQTNYDYMRALGRGDLASRAQLNSANLEGSLINARNTNTNLLLGAGLDASGRLFSPVNSDPFNLKKLRP